MPFSFNPQEDTYTVDPNSLSLTFAPPDQRREDPGWLETMTAAWERHNLIWNIGAMITQPTFGDEAGYSPFRRIDPDLPYNEQTNPWGEIAGYEMFANRFTGSRSTQETAYIRAKIDKEMRNIDILERGGAFGILASILAGSLDPLVVIPPIKAVRGVKLGATVLRQGGKATLQNAGIIAGQEMGLQIAQETRSIEESAAAITIGAIFTGILVGVGGGMSRSVRLKAAKHIDDVDQAMTAQAKQADAGKGDVLAHSDSPDALRTQPLKAGDEANGKSLAGIYEKEAAGATPDAARGVVARYGARWMARHAILRSSVESVRRFAHQSVLSPWVVKGSKVVHDRIEALKYGWHGKVVASMAKIQGLHKNLVRKVEGGDVDIQKLNIIDATIGNRAGKDQMSMPKFYEWVMKVMRRTPEEVAELKRAHGLPEEIFVAVDIVRKEVFDPLFGWGVRVGVFTKEQKNISYLTRMYNRELFRDKGQRHAFITALSTYWQKLPSDAGHLSLKRANKRAAEVARVIMRDPDEGMGAALLSQPLRERTLDVPDSVIEKWLVSDLEYIVRTYAKSMVGDLALIERFGRAQIMRVVGASRENFLNAAGELQKLQAKIKQAQEAGPRRGKRVAKGEGATVATDFSGLRTMEAAIGPHRSVHAAEIDPKINAEANRAHGTDFAPQDVHAVNPEDIADADLYHASPVCKSLSQANLKRKVKQEDIDSANKIASNIIEGRPKTVSVENVPEFATKPDLMDPITEALDEAGYAWDVQIHDAADYGGAMSRKRMVIRAVRDGELPPTPPKSDPADWYKTIEDLIDEAPDAPFRPEKGRPNEWEPKRIAGMVERGELDPKEPIITMGGSASRGVAYARNAGGPAPTLKATTKEKGRIILADGRVKELTPRMMARLMGLPDSFRIPKDKGLAKSGIGNGIHGATTRNFIEPLLRLDAPTPKGGFGPTYYRGSKKGDKRRIQTGEEEFDSYLFVTDTRKGAEAYGPDVQEVTFKPGARILREGTKEFVRIAGRHRKGESLLDFSARATRLAKEDGYDAVHFKLQTDVGTAIMNPDAVVRGGMRARSAFANKQVAKQLKAAEKAFDVRLAAAKKDLVAGFTPAAGLGGDSWKRAVDAAFSTQNLRNWAAEVEPKTADLFDDAAKKLMDDWGGGDLRLLMDEVSSDLGKQIKTAEAAGNVKLRQKLMTERNRTLGFIEDTRNFLRGTHGIGADPTAMTPRVLSAVRQWNYMTVGGFIPVASLPDLGLVIMQTGMRRAFGSALSVWSSALRKESNLAKIDIHRLLGGSEVLTNARATEMFILEESHMALNKGERGLHRVSHAYSVGTGLAHYNQMMKDIVGMGTVQMIMENADEFVKRGKFLSGADELRLRDWGVDENFLRRVHGEWSNKAHVMDGKRSTRAINVDAWDQEIADSVRNVVFTSQKLSILSGGPLDLPKLGRDIRAVGVGRQTSASGRAAAAGAARSRATADAWAQTIFQFYNFGFAATSRILSRSVEIADMRVLQGVSASMALGAFSVMLRAKLNDKEIPEVGSLIAQSIDQAGLLGIFMDIGRPIEQAFQGEIGLSAVLEPFGLELRGSRYITSQTMLETLIGSSAGIPIAAVKTAFGILDGDMSDKDKRNFLRMIPAANMWYIRGLMNNLNGDEFDPIDYDDFFGADK